MHERAPSATRFVAELTDVAEVFLPCVESVVWRRSPRRSLLAEAHAHAAGRVALQIVVDPRAAAALLREQLPAAPQLAHDIALLVEVLSELTEAARVGVRLARLDTPMCPRWHVDHVGIRVVCTYLGAGTEMVDNELVDRSKLGHGSGGLDDSASGVLRAGARIVQAGVGHVAFLKGEAWPEQRGRGAVHRSPSASAAHPRMVLTLDALASEEEGR